MTPEIQLTREPIPEHYPLPAGVAGGAGAWVEFRGLVRDEEDDRAIAALQYEAYDAMARSELRRLAGDLAAAHPVLAVMIVHRLGVVRVGEAAIYVGVASKHRQPGYSFLSAFMDRLKQDVPIWKCRALTRAELPSAASA